MAHCRTVETVGVVEAVVDMEKVVEVAGIARPPHTVSVTFLSLSLPLPPAVSVLSLLHRASFCCVSVLRDLHARELSLPAAQPSSIALSLHRFPTEFEGQRQEA